MKDEMTLNNKEKKIILLVREITQQDNLVNNIIKPISKSQYSKNGLKKGCKFTDTSGKKVNITEEKNAEMVSFIQDEIIDYEKNRIQMYGPIIIKNVKEKFNISLSPAYINNIKKKIGEQNGC